MGLDQCIYRVKKLELSERIYTSEELGGMDLDKVAVEDFENCKGLFGQLKPYMVKRDVLCKLYDIEKMIADYNLPSGSRIWRYSYDDIELSGYDENNQQVSRAISRDEIERKYIKTEIIPHYIFSREEVCYWRKHYDLQDWIYEHVSNADNTAYCILSADLINELNETFDEDIPIEEPTDESALFYWEWY